jgi:O-antigen/teichoic acid export membrane protein
VTFALGTSVVQIVLSIVLVVWLRQGVEGVYLAQLLTYLGATVVAGWMLRDWIAPRHLDAGRLTDMLRYAGPLIPAGLAFWVISGADRYVLRAFATTADVGLYSIAASIASVVALLTVAFQQAWGPFAMSIHAAPGARETYARVFLAYALVGSGLAAGAALFAPEAIRLLATPRYAGAAVAVGPLAFSVVVAGLTTIASIGPSLAKRTGPTALAFMFAAIAQVLLNPFLTVRLGMVGCAVATLIAQAVAPAYLFVRSQRVYPIPYRFASGALVLVGGVSLALAAPWIHVGGFVTTVLVKLALLGILFTTAAVPLGLTPALLRRRFGAGPVVGVPGPARGDD